MNTVRYSGNRPGADCEYCQLPILPGDPIYPATSNRGAVHEWCEYSLQHYGEMTRASVSREFEDGIPNKPVDFIGYKQRKREADIKERGIKWEDRPLGETKNEEDPSE